MNVPAALVCPFNLLRSFFGRKRERPDPKSNIVYCTDPDVPMWAFWGRTWRAEMKRLGREAGDVVQRHLGSIEGFKRGNRVYLLDFDHDVMDRLLADADIDRETPRYREFVTFISKWSTQ